MLTAMVGNTYINTIEHNKDELRKWSDKGLIKCPITGMQVKLRWGKIKIPHFAYKATPDWDMSWWERETKEHYLGKTLLFKWLKRMNGIEDLKLEGWIPETKQRPDLMFILNNNTYIIEYQCTPITLEEYLEREKLYELVNYKSIWILGTDNFNAKQIIKKDKSHKYSYSVRYKDKALPTEIYETNKTVYYFDSYNNEITMFRKPFSSEYYYSLKYRTLELGKLLLINDKNIECEEVN